MLRTFSPWRLRAIGWFLTIAFLVCAGRLYYLQILAHPQFEKISESNRIRLETHPAKRGEITDCNGELLATHETRMVLGLDSRDIEDDDRVKLPKLAAILGLPIEAVSKAANSNKAWIKLREGVDETTYKELLDLKVKGVYGYPSYDRIYPKGSMACHVLGFVDKSGSANAGVEKMMDFYLKGQEGWRETERDGKRRELGQFRSREVPSVDGLNVELSIDLQVQSEIEDQMKSIVSEYHPDDASIIVSDPKTGFILGMCNTPSFDPNQYSKYPLENYRNRAISDMLEPGSTFKIVTISAGLDEKVITPDTVFDCGAKTAMYRGKELPLPREHEPLGHLAVRDIIAKSSNKGAAQIGMKLGEELMYKYASDFGYGHITGIGLPGESPGLLMQVKHWDGLTITRMPMGHAIAGTPLQIHYAMSTIANNGVLMTPQVIKRIYDENGNTVLNFSPRPRRQVITPATAQLMAKLLIRTVSPEGTAPKAQIPGYQVAGKTGTTQKLINGHYSDTHHIGTFSGFFPSSDPRLVITVIIDNPHLHGIGYGGEVSAPVFKAIATRLIQHLAIPPVEEVAANHPKKF